MTDDARPEGDTPPRQVPAWLRRWGPPILALAVFTAALLVLRGELRTLRYADLMAALLSQPLGALGLAVLLTLANYAALGGYDLLALRYVGRAVAPGRVMLASFVAYALSNNVGFGALTGASVRYRFYSRWGVTPAELSRIVLFYMTTFWLGLMLLGGLSLALDPMPALRALPGHRWATVAGVALIGLCALYALGPAVRRAPLRLGGLTVSLPSPGQVAGQFALSSLDWALAAGAAWVLLPPGRVGFPLFLGAYLTAQLVALASHVPGGVGVFETLLLLLLRPVLPAGELLPALLVYRTVYYLLPLVLALGLLVGDEVRLRRQQAERVRALFGALEQELTPRLLAVFTFLGGVVLLWSGATPAAHGRLGWLARLLPLGIVELSHFAGSLLGVGLLLLSRGIARRLDASFYLVAAGLGLGIAACLLKGADYEEAAVLLTVLLALVRSRSFFDRRAAFFAGRFSPGWVTAVLAAVGSAVWLGLFSFRHVTYSDELWWRFGFGHEASRFLRGAVGSAVALLCFAVSRLLRPAPPALTAPGEQDLARAEAVIASQRSTTPFLVFLQDKSLLFDAEGDAFLMYGVRGRTWVALHGPVGPEARAGGLVRAFLERCDDYDGVPIFYEVPGRSLALFADFGFAFAKLGEEARVPLPSLSLEGGASKALRQSVRRLDREGGAFRVLSPEEVARQLPELRAVSDEWLSQKGAAEKGFSLGFFEETYVARFPVAAVERAGRIEAFASLWPGPGGEELSVDLMRFRETAPPGVMEALLVHLMLWGRDRGYRWFGLGMAPLSGLEGSPAATLWSRLGSFLYEHGEALYNFRGLRGFKDKFHPAWEPRYLVYPGGLKLPRVLADVAALIAGGYRRIFLR